jgi:dephospho-CoA kinase
VTFDADKIAHLAMEPGRPAFDETLREFGMGILGADGRIDRARLGAIVFADEFKRRRLNAIVHPRVMEEQDRLLREADEKDPNGIAIIDAALMIESGGYKRFDKVIVVFCGRDEQVERLIKRNQVTRADAERRIAAQMSSDEKRRYADFEIDTSGTQEQTRERVADIYAQLRELQQTSNTLVP